MLIQSALYTVKWYNIIKGALEIKNNIKKEEILNIFHLFCLFTVLNTHWIQHALHT